MRVAFVTSAFADSWSEDHVLALRLAGAVACGAEVELLVAEDAGASHGHDGALPTRWFPLRRPGAGQRAWLRREVFGSAADEGCGCTLEALSEVVDGLPAHLERRILEAEGGDSPELVAELRARSFDVVVFVGWSSAVTFRGMAAVADHARIVLVPAARDPLVLRLGIAAEIFGRAERVVTVTGSEWTRVAERFADELWWERRVVGIPVAVNPVAASSEPSGFSPGRHVVLPIDRTRSATLVDLAPALAELETVLGITISVAGPPGAALPPELAACLRPCSSRTDVWRWMARARVVLDPEPGRVLGQFVLEAMLFGRPVVVHERGLANREHAERGRGGLWFADATELRTALEILLTDPGRAERIGSQGRSYAAQEHGDPESFVARVREAVLGEVA